MTKDYLTYLSRFFKYVTSRAIINLLLFIVFVIIAIRVWPNHLWLMIILFLIISTSILIDMIAFVKRVNRLLIKKGATIKQLSYVNSHDFGQINLADLKPSIVESGNGFEEISIKSNDMSFLEKAFYSKGLNTYLRQSKLNIVVDKTKTKNVKDFISKHKSLLLQFLHNKFKFSMKNNKLFTNGEKVLLSREFDLANNQAYIAKGEFFSGFITNDVCSTQLKDKSGRTITDPTPIFPATKTDDGVFRLLSLAESSLHNQIGACTLAVTNDNFLIIWKQSERAQYSNNLLVSTGSGSADWDDVVKNDFSQTVINTMERELAEESRLLGQSRENFKTKILGYFRWVRRGGLPEFVGITKLNLKLNDLSPDFEEVKMPKTLNTFHVDSIGSLNMTIDNIMMQNEGEISVPLYMNLLFLKQYATNEPDELGKFLFGEV